MFSWLSIFRRAKRKAKPIFPDASNTFHTTESNLVEPSNSVHPPSINRPNKILPFSIDEAFAYAPTDCGFRVIAYANRDGEISFRPISNERKNGNLITAYCHVAQDVRTFRADRILESRDGTPDRTFNSFEDELAHVKEARDIIKAEHKGAKDRFMRLIDNRDDPEFFIADTEYKRLCDKLDRVQTRYRSLVGKVSAKSRK